MLKEERKNLLSLGRKKKKGGRGGHHLFFLFEVVKRKKRDGRGEERPRTSLITNIFLPGEGMGEETNTSFFRRIELGETPREKREKKTDEDPSLYKRREEGRGGGAPHYQDRRS